MWLRLRRLARMLGRDTLVLWFACRHPATPLPVKLAALLLALYLFSPIDLIPDWLPVVGWIDDAALLAFAIPILLRLLPAAVRTDAQGATARWLARWKPGIR